jgi:hypothetical protein
MGNGVGVVEGYIIIGNFCMGAPGTLPPPVVLVFRAYHNVHGNTTI